MTVPAVVSTVLTASGIMEAVHPPAILRSGVNVARDVDMTLFEDRLTSHDDEVRSITLAIFGLDTNDPFLKADIFAYEARELAVRLAENELDASLLAEIPGVDTSLWSMDHKIKGLGGKNSGNTDLVCDSDAALGV